MTDLVSFSFRKAFDSCIEELEIDAGDYEFRMNKKNQNQNKKNTEEVKEAEIVVKNNSTPKRTAVQTLTNTINHYRQSRVQDLTKKYGKYCWGVYYGNRCNSPAVIVAFRNNKYSVPSWTEIKTMISSIEKTFKNKNEFIEWIKKEAFQSRLDLSVINDLEKIE